MCSEHLFHWKYRYKHQLNVCIKQFSSIQNPLIASWSIFSCSKTSRFSTLPFLFIFILLPSLSFACSGSNLTSFGFLLFICLRHFLLPFLSKIIHVLPSLLHLNQKVQLIFCWIIETLSSLRYFPVFFRCLHKYVILWGGVEGMTLKLCVQDSSNYGGVLNALFACKDVSTHWDRVQYLKE